MGAGWYQVDLPKATGHRRQRLRRGGFGTDKEARRVADKVRALLTIPDADDDEAKLAVADLVRRHTRRGRRLPGRAELQ